MFKIMGKLKVYLITFAAFAAFSGVAYWYYRDSQAAIIQYAENQARLEEALRSQQSATMSLKRDIAIMGTTLNTLNDDFTASRQRVQDLESLLQRGTDGRYLNVGERAIEDPEYIENEINIGTNEVFSCFEILSGNNTDENDPKYINCINTVTGNGVQQ